MNRTRLLALLLAVVMLLLGFAAGTAATTYRLAGTDAQQPPTSSSQPSAITNTPTPPTEDAPGADIPGLPRYPGAIRTEYRHELVDGFYDTEVEYLVTADFDAVHDFYRSIFDEQGWIVADIGIHMGEWTFLVVSGSREALVELEVEYGLVEIEIEVTEPVTSGE